MSEMNTVDMSSESSSSKRKLNDVNNVDDNVLIKEQSNIASIEDNKVKEVKIKEVEEIIPTESTKSNKSTVVKGLFFDDIEEMMFGFGDEWLELINLIIFYIIYYILCIIIYYYLLCIIIINYIYNFIYINYIYLQATR
jgi:uncharacterized membrane protein